jgi:hypothetical protein
MSSGDGEILGLKANNNGRSCEQHDCCGVYVVENDLVRFKLTIVDNNEGLPEPAIKAVFVKDGTELCTVGFLARNIVAREQGVAKYVDKFGQILELYDNHPNSKMKRTKSQRNSGMASFRLLEDIQNEE